MYTQFFNLTQSPFSIAPDPRYLYMSERHREALAHLLYGVGSGGGFVLLTGEIGAGKTTVCRCFMEQVPAHCKLAYIFNPKLSVEELLSSICDEFGIAQDGPASVKTHVDAINRYLLASHAQARNNVLIIDEAQNLSGEVLEQLRLLTNLETSERKLLQIILIGQPELRTMLARPELEQLGQRVIARYHLGALPQREVGNYIAYRLAVAGGGAQSPFPQRLLARIHRISKGVPRRINLLCDRALLGAYVENRRQVTRNILQKAGAEVFDGAASRSGARWQWALAGVAAGALIGGAAFWFAAPMLQHAARDPVPAIAIAQDGVQDSVQDSADLPALAALWGVQLSPAEACQQAVKRDVRCHLGKGGLVELRLLDRPALLTARPGSASSAALLTGLSDTQATLRIAGKEQRIGVADFGARFGDDFVTLWRAPSAWRNELSVGDRGPDVDAMASRLAHWDDMAAVAENQPFDAALQARLRAFQSSQQLNADGVAGPKTLIRLVREGGAAEPRLSNVNSLNVNSVNSIGAGK
jgi:general secretion pathway protein A